MFVVNALQRTSPTLCLLTKFGSRLGKDDEAAIRSISFETKSFVASKRLVSNTDPVSTCQLLIKGFACRSKVLSDGRRQVVAAYVPGDFIDLGGSLLAKSDHHVMTHGPTTLAFVSHTQLSRVFEAHPHLGRLMWQETLLEAAICREWLINVGARSATARIAHLFCEIITRLQGMGLATAYSSDFPFSQEVLGEAVGLSTVSVNRNLQELRRLGLVKFTRGKLAISDWSGLVDLAEFNSGYLHQADGPI